MEFDEAYGIAEAAVRKINKRLNARVQVAILRGTWQGQTYEVIAETATYTPRYLQQDAGPKLWKLLTEAFGAEVNKNNFRTFLETGFQRTSLPSLELSPEPSNGFWHQNTHRLDLKDAPDVSRFCGRDRTRQELKDLIFNGCRVLCIYGMGGVGKTALAVKLAQELQDTFDGVIYRSLNPPVAIAQIETEVIHYLTHDPDPEPGWSNLLTQLCNHRCLVILDGWESLLCSNVHDGFYLPGCTPYGELLQRIGHARGIQSCFIITSREKPKEVENLEDEAAHYCSYRLYGLGETSGRSFLALKNLAAEDENHWRELLNRYAGNPQLLNLAATRIRIFGGNITSFLNQISLNGSFAGEIGELLDQHLRRLSEPEQLVVNCLAKYTGYASFTVVLQLVAQRLSDNQLAEVLQSLLRRSLIQAHQDSYELQPLFKRYLAGQSS